MSAHHDENKSKEKTIGKAEALFSFSEKLFRLYNDTEIEFVILKSSRDADIVSNLIKLGGGLPMIKPNPTPGVVNLCCYSEPWMEQHIIFNTSYVYACCLANRRLSLKEYSIGKTLSDEEYKKFNDDYLALDKYEFDSLDEIDWTDAPELDLEGNIPLEPPVKSSNCSSDFQKSSSPKKCNASSENHSVGKQEEKMDVPLRSEQHQEGSSSSSLSSKRKTCNILSKNTAMDVDTGLDIHPKDSVSQIGTECMPSGSSSVAGSSGTSYSNCSSHSCWSRSVRMWMADDDDTE